MTRIIDIIKNYKYRHFNFALLICVLALTILGIFAIASATDSNLYEKKQVFGLIIGIIAATIAIFTNYKFVLKFAWVIYALNLILLIWVKVGGSHHMGATRWIDLKFFQLQPSEFTKIFIILFLGYYINKNKEKLNTFKFLVKVIILFAIPLALVLLQPDLSTSIVISLIFCGIMYVSGLSYKIIGGIFAAIIPLGILFLYLIMQPNQHILKSYQLERITSFMNDSKANADNRRQQENSVMAIGSGGLYGKGLNNNTTTSLKNGQYLSEPQTDFIFCIVGEELGFIGTSIVIILLFLIVICCFYVGAHAPDLAGKIIACGYGFMIAIQSFVNIGVVTMLIPNTGLPLPFVSYGISSLFSLFIGLGVVLNISLQHSVVN